MCAIEPSPSKRSIAHCGKGYHLAEATDTLAYRFSTEVNLEG